MAQVAQSDPHTVLERAAEPATAGDSPTNPNATNRNFTQPDRQRPTHFNVRHDPHPHYPQHQPFRDDSHYDPNQPVPVVTHLHQPQPQDTHLTTSPDRAPSDEPQPEDLAEAGATNHPDLPALEEHSDDYPQHDSGSVASADLPAPVPPGIHPPSAQPSPAVMGLVASFGDISLGTMPYGAAPPMPMLSPIIPMVAPQIPTHQQRHHHHHQHQLQHPHIVNQSSTYQLWVPQERVGAVIGGHGTVIRSLQERSGATIQVHNDTVRGDRKLFTIFGSLAQYDIAKQLINDIVEKPRQGHGGGHAGSHASDRSPYSPVGDHGSRSGELCKTVYVPTSCVGLVIGRNGETIRNLQDRSGADIKVTPDEEAQPGADQRSILISGTDDAISTAHQFVSEIVMDAKSRRPPHSGPPIGTSVNGQPIVFEVLAVPNEKVGLIIGKKGAAIRDLQMKSGAKIQVTKDDSSVQSDGTRPVTLTGMRANVDEAKAMIANKINMPLLQSQTVGTTYNSPPPQAGGSVASPAGPSQPGPAYMVPSMYDPAYQNGQQPFQQVYDANDPSEQHRAMAYFQYVGYNNFLAQQRQFQSQLPMHYQHPQQQEQQQGLNTPQQEQQDPMGQPSQYPSPPMQQGQQLEGGIQGSPGMVPRDGSGNVLMYPSHHYQQLPPHLGGHQIYSSGAPNARMYPRREQMQAAQAHAQMLMQQAHAHAQAHSHHAQAQAHAQAHAQAEAESQTRQQILQPSVSTPPEDNEQPNG